MKISPLTIQLTSLISVNSREFGDQPWNLLKSVVGAVLIWADMDMKYYEMIRILLNISVKTLVSPGIQTKKESGLATWTSREFRWSPPLFPIPQVAASREKATRQQRVRCGAAKCQGRNGTWWAAGCGALG